jgi:Fur family ferric uptake transcriptional regulator
MHRPVDTVSQLQTIRNKVETIVSEAAGIVPELAGALRRAGHRLTAPRRAVWEVLHRAETHLTAEGITERVRGGDPGINVSSVYRTLGLLTDLGLVRESNLGPTAASHWELAHPDEEFHLRCLSCHRVEHHGGDLVEEVRAHLRGEHGFEATGVELVVTGHCARCLAGEPR